jgi:hypothetical protein
MAYAGVTTTRDEAPYIVTGALTGRNNKGLAFSVALAPGQIAFGEIPLVVDASHTLSEEEHKERHNSRSAWGIAEECLKRLSPQQIQNLLAADYATGILDGRWESPGDDRALAYLATRYVVDPGTTRRLYDLMATNCVAADTGLKPVPLPGGGRVHVMVPLYGFFALLSRANHSCCPSATLTPPKSTPRGPLRSVITTRRVEAGEALTIDYLHTEPLATKRLALWAQFGFTCACERCETLCSLLSCSAKGDKSCSVCHKARYCGREHQVADWPRHKGVCSN